MNDDEYLTIQQRCEKAEAERDGWKHTAKQNAEQAAFAQKWAVEVEAERDSCSRVATTQSVLTSYWMHRAEEVEAERDEAKATKDMHKERQEEYQAECAALRAKLDEANKGWLSQASRDAAEFIRVEAKLEKCREIIGTRGHDIYCRQFDTSQPCDCGYDATMAETKVEVEK